jgi:hypothetical protein
MPTSGTSTFMANRDTIVRRALRMVGAFPSTDLPRPEQLTDAIVVLNLLLKTASIANMQWLRTFRTVTLVAGQNSYALGASTPIPIDRPLHVFAANRKSTSGNEIPMTSLTRTDWMALPNKSSNGVPVQYYYDPQTINGTLYVWPTPSVGTTDKLILDVDRQLDIMTDSLDDFDFPMQWQEVLCYMLACRLAPEYGVPLGERQLLTSEADRLFAAVESDDRDIASIYFGVRR